MPPKGPVKSIVSDKTPREAIPSLLELSKVTPANKLANIPLDKRTGNPASIPDMSSVTGLSIDKHVDKQKYKIAYSLDKLTDDLARAASSPRKKDKEYIKGIVWSIGVLFDKLANGTQQDAIVVRIPARLLENVKAVIAIQASKKAAPVVVNPAPVTTALDTESSGSVMNTTGYVLPVAEVVAHDTKTLGPAPNTLA